MDFIEAHTKLHEIADKERKKNKKISSINRQYERSLFKDGKKPLERRKIQCLICGKSTYIDFTDNLCYKTKMGTSLHECKK